MYADIVVCFVNLNYKLMHLPVSAWTTSRVNEFCGYRYYLRVNGKKYFKND